MNKLTLSCLVTIATIGITKSPETSAQSFFDSIGTSTCGVPLDVYRSVKSKERGPVDGGYDEDGDGKVSHIEAFTTWDFLQTESVLHSGIEHQEYTWTNIDTCYKFHVVAHDFYEDKSQPVLWQTCRTFDFYVTDPDGNRIGGNTSQVGCRNFGTHDWWLL